MEGLDLLVPDSPKEQPALPAPARSLHNALLFAPICGAIGGAIGAILGVLGLEAGQLLGPLGRSVGGSVAAATAGVLCARGLTDSIRPWWKTGIWFVAGAALVLTLDWYIPTRFSWPIYRWALGAVALGIFFGALGGPTAQDDAPVSAKAQLFRDLATIVAAVVTVVLPQRLACVLLGAAGGGMGGMFFLAIIGGLAGEQGEAVFGSYAFFPIAGAALGGVGGACGGWVAGSESSQDAVASPPHGPATSPPPE